MRAWTSPRTLPATLSAASALPRPTRHGFLASTTERHAGGRDMALVAHRRSCSGCCWRAESRQRTSITPGGIARVDRRVGAGAVARFSFKMLGHEGGPTGHSDLVKRFQNSNHMGPSEFPHFAVRSPRTATDQNHGIGRLVARFNQSERVHVWQAILTYVATPSLVAPRRGLPALRMRVIRG